MTCYSLFYLPSYNYVFKGSKKKLWEHLKFTGEFVFEGGNGSWIVGMPPKREILILVDGKITGSASPDNYLYNRIGLSKITKADCQKLVDSLNDGKVKISELTEN